jgi:hypothetical protein
MRRVVQDTVQVGRKGRRFGQDVKLVTLGLNGDGLHDAAKSLYAFAVFLGDKLCAFFERLN